MFNKNSFKRVLFNTSCLSIFMLSTNVFAVSFDCSKATQRSEKMVCASPLLSSLDDQMFALYTKAKQSSSNPEALKQSQIDWIKQVRGCDSEKCVENLYKKRISDFGPQNTITSALGTISPSAPNQIVTQESKPTDNQQPTTSETAQQQSENRQEAPAESNKEVIKQTTTDNDNSETSIFSIILGFILTLLVIAVPFIGGRKKK